MSTTLVDSFRKALKSSVPLVAITTPDPAMTIASLLTVRPAEIANEEYAVLQWDAVDGLTITAAEEQLDPRPPHLVSGDVKTALLKDQAIAAGIKNLSFALTHARKLPANTILFIHNAHRFLHDTAVMQAVWHLRDHFKNDGKTLVLLAPHLKLPVELIHDVIVLDDPLPNRDQLRSIISLQYDNAKAANDTIPDPSTDHLDQAVDAVHGLSAFAAEQAIAMSFTAKGICLPKLWEHKYQAIEQTPGLKIYRGAERFDEIGGVAHIKHFLRQILNGRAKPGGVVFLDELEKGIAGANSKQGDNTGVSQDIHKQLLEFMQNEDATGIIMVGLPGTSKSMVSKAAGKEAGIPTIEFDLGGVKSASVGASEHNMRQALKVIGTITNHAPLFLATCNSLHAISPELRRRFRLGTFIFPLPSREERAAIWRIYQNKYELTEEPGKLLDERWTGAEIRQCADIAWRLNIPLAEAAGYIVPVAVSAKESIAALYDQAHQAFLCASYPGPFNKDRAEDAKPTPVGRRMRVIATTEGEA
jgi:hypothetical protein